MAVKTITIDVEAYSRLKAVQKPDESFSQTIKRVVRKPFDVDAWLKKLEEIRLSDEAVEAIERKVANRRRNGTRER
jgi:predicted CopG family antitoxin